MQLPQFKAHADMEERHWWFLARRRILQTLLGALLPPSKEKLVIDIGCGTGGLTHFFASKYSTLGIDPSADAIAFAKSRFPECRFIQGIAPHDVTEIKTADAVLLIEVLEHVEDDRGLVQSILSSMKQGAYLMIMAPADMSLWGPHDDAFEHVRRYESLEQFRALWNGTSATELLVSYCNTRLYPVVKAMRVASAARGKAWGQGGTDISVPMRPVNALLKRIYTSEARELLRMLKGKRKPFRKGVTAIGILRA